MELALRTDVQFDIPPYQVLTDRQEVEQHRWWAIGEPSKDVYHAVNSPLEPSFFFGRVLRGPCATLEILDKNLKGLGFKVSISLGTWVEDPVTGVEMFFISNRYI